MVDCHHKDNPSHFQTVSYTDFKLKEKRAAVLARHRQIPRFEVSVSVSGEKKMYLFMTSRMSAGSPTMLPSHSSHSPYSEQ